ncbi:MAG: sigma-54-dependent Fis family transcriptional regulator [Verrucomicrobia bacterium]|nr:sigma-54-dependent Fis family transcriptional regulator [Verrucomicrobiota bacterium]MCH8511671.1 sigma-54 dependent transcriptional regulator [Kiritimatiellia bacterium]
MKKPAILIVDDERNTREGLARALRRHYEIHLAESGMAALNVLDAHPVDAVLTDLRMPGMDGLTLVRRVLARDPQPVCILLTAYGNVETAVEAMKNGAYDFLTKPVNLDRLEVVLKRALESRTLVATNRSLRQQLDEKYGMEQIIGESGPMQAVFDTIRQVAPSRATVLIQGESGTGKELVAHALHNLSPRKKNPFVAVHCAALSDNLLESELFGHERGAFTGATEARKGRFELADGGSLFLDEIGEIQASTQVKLLRVMEERSFERVGGVETLDVDVRLIAATNRDLRVMVEEEKFREDLYFRLNVVQITLPPLRERRDDIPLLLNSFLHQFREENGRTLEGFTPDALEALNQYRWPGNIRELRNLVERMVVLSRGDKITLRDVPREVREGGDGKKTSGPLAGAVSMEQAEKRMIEQALNDNDGNRTLAAKQLGISRRTLHRKLNEFGLR